MPQAPPINLSRPHAASASSAPPFGANHFAMKICWMIWPNQKNCSALGLGLGLG